MRNFGVPLRLVLRSFGRSIGRIALVRRMRSCSCSVVRFFFVVRLPYAVDRTVISECLVGCCCCWCYTMVDKNGRRIDQNKKRGQLRMEKTGHTD
ncbi:hypothetical protein GE21DRAFT_1068504 [Neurospora crassa]|nr:hypothetical protein GE21DRAFT_1068504 [Neurospora crassa]